MVLERNACRGNASESFLLLPFFMLQLLRKESTFRKCIEKRTQRMHISKEENEMH